MDEVPITYVDSNSEFLHPSKEVCEGTPTLLLDGMSHQ